MSAPLATFYNLWSGDGIVAITVFFILPGVFACLIFYIIRRSDRKRAKRIAPPPLPKQ